MNITLIRSNKRKNSTTYNSAEYLISKLENVDKVYEELNKLIPTLQESFTKNLSEHFRQTPEMNNELFDKYCYSIFI